MEKYDQAINQCENALELDPHSVSANSNLSSAYILKGEMSKGIRILEAIVDMFGPIPILKGYLGWAYSKAGRIEDARRLGEEIYMSTEKSYVPAIYLAMIHSGLGDIEKCFDLLNEAVDEHYTQISHIHFDPVFKPVRAHPRYKALLRKMNLEP